MSSKNNEARLWQKVKKGLTDCFLTRIESSTINGIPDIHAVHKQEVFWIELKSDSLSYPALNKWQVVWINKYVKAGGKVIILKENLGKTPLQSVLKLYRPVSLFTEPRSKEEKMAVDFDALDLVRTQNKARSYNTKLDGLVQENTELRTLVADLTKEMPEGNRKLMYQERLKKIENSS
jgi:Holliday junction resolvase